MSCMDGITDHSVIVLFSVSWPPVTVVKRQLQGLWSVTLLALAAANPLHARHPPARIGCTRQRLTDSIGHRINTHTRGK